MLLRGEAKRAWAQVDRTNIGSSWASLIPRLLAMLTGAQHAAAASADRYTVEVLTAQRLSPATQGRVDASVFSGIASDGRSLESLLAQPGITAKVWLAQGKSVDEAMNAGSFLAQLIAHTQVTDAGRTADQVALTARAAAGGYVRMIQGATCSRCLLLAGRWYRWNTGFLRHPHCDCVHIPSAEDRADDLRTDPKRAFAAMDRAEQDRVFGKPGAQAIRDGADMAKVVNARRGMATAGQTTTRVNEAGRVVNVTRRSQVTTSAFGKDVFGTTEAAGRAPRLMPEQIYLEAAGDRDEALRLLKRFGYLL